MSIESQLQKIESMYSDNLSKMGVDSRSVGWNSDACQKLRFAKLASLIGKDECISVNDLGCGYGSLLEFLTKDVGCQVSKYYGYDISEKMLLAASQALVGYGDDVVELRQEKEISNMADYSFVSGTFNVRFDASYEDWTQHIKSSLINMHEQSEKGFAFNLLTSYVDWEETHLYYGDPLYWFDFCKKNFSRKVSVLHDYDLWEWTILVRK